MESVVENKALNHNESMMSIDSANNSFISHTYNSNNGNNSNGDNGEVFTYRVSPLYKASYSNVEVIEMEVNGCSIMRRLKDSFFNATQILKLVVLDRSKRSKLLESEIFQGEHEKIQGGAGKYQGTWIPYDRTVSLCRRYEIYEVLKPLLMFNPTVSNDQVPTKDQLARTYSTLTDADEGISKSDSQDPNGDNEEYDKSPKRTKYNSLPSLEIFDHDTKVANPNAPFTVRPIQDSKIDEKSKVVMSSLFLPNQNDLTLLDLVSGDESQLVGVSIDVPIDDNGQTALHLAATLGRISLVKDLVKRGSNRIRGDNDGQTALIRAVHATNCLEYGCFDQLLDYLYPAITVLDHKGRTVLHHIAYTCGRKGRNEACKYYLETLLEWVVKRGPYLPGNQNLNLTKFMQDVINIPDRNGDTCLNIAAMVGNKHIIQQLLEVGADPNRANKAGVKPIDCGISVKSTGKFNSMTSIAAGPASSATATTITTTRSSNNTDQSSTINTGLSGATKQSTFSNFEPRNIESENSSKILDSIQTYVSQLGKDFKDEITLKTNQINSMHPKLREKTLKLSEKRKDFEELSKILRKLNDYKSKIINLNKAISEEDSRFVEQTKELPLTSRNFDGDFDADEPFTVWSVYHEVEQKLREMKAKQAEGTTTTESHRNVTELLSTLKPSDLQVSQQQDDLPPSVVLEARIKAYEKNNEQLIQRTKIRKSSSNELENQFKRVIGLCIGSESNEIDEKLLSSLLLSVENDPDPEIKQIKKVLKIVNDLDGK